MNNNINWDAVKGMDKTIGECAFLDMKKAQPKKPKFGKVYPYSLSANTIYLQETKNRYVSGEITEEEAKVIFLRQRTCGNVL